MNTVDSFVMFYGVEKSNNLLTYMRENNIFDEFELCKEDTGKLFIFGIKYGLIDIVKFLYEELYIEYDHDILFGFDVTLNSRDILPTSLEIGVEYNSNGNTRLNLTTWDKFTRNRNICINYLIDMKKYSKMRYKNKKFYYKFINNNI